MIRLELQGSNVNVSVPDLSANISDGGKPSSMPWDNSDPFFSAHVRDAIVMVLKCYIRQFIIFVGIPGNAMSCVVFMKQGLSDRINLLLFSLAASDLTNLVTQILMVCDCYLEDHITKANWLAVAKPKIAYMANFINFVTGALMVVVSVDRCLSVAMPLKAKGLLTYRVTVTAIMVSYAVPLIFYIPGFLLSVVEWKIDPATNRSIAFVDYTRSHLGDSRLYMMALSTFVLVAKSALLAIAITCCTITIVKLRQAAVKRLRMTGKSSEELGTADNRVTKMLLLLCIVYIVFGIPEVCSTVAVAIFPEYFVYRKYHNTLAVVYRFLWMAACLNSAANFFAYLVLSSGFRRTLKAVWICQRHKMKSND